MAAWVDRLKLSLDKNRSLAYARYVQLATVKLDGGPANRTVVYRGLLQGADAALTFITDQRSRKVQEVAANPAAEAAWYFPITREQYRLTGSLTIVGEQHPDAKLLAARQYTWDKLSDAARAQFAWPQPGLPRAIEPDAFTRTGAPGPQEPPLPTFCLVVLDVKEVDYINLFKNTRTAYQLQQDGQWHTSDVNP